MIAVTHSAATSPRSTASITAISLASHGAGGFFDSRGSRDTRAVGAFPRRDPAPVHHEPSPPQPAAALVQQSTPVGAERPADGSMTWATATPGISIAAAAAAALAAAATPAEPWGLAFTDTDDDSSDGGSSSDHADEAEVRDELWTGTVDHQLQPMIASCQIVHETQAVAADTGDGDMTEGAAAARVPVEVSPATHKSACRTSGGQSLPQPQHAQLSSKGPASSQHADNTAALDDGAVRWVAADVVAPLSDTPVAGTWPGDTPAIVDRSPASPIPGDTRSPCTSAAEAGALVLPLSRRPSRIPRPPIMTPGSTVVHRLGRRHSGNPARLYDQRQSSDLGR